MTSSRLISEYNRWQACTPPSFDLSLRSAIRQGGFFRSSCWRNPEKIQISFDPAALCDTAWNQNLRVNPITLGSCEMLLLRRR